MVLILSIYFKKFKIAENWWKFIFIMIFQIRHNYYKNEDLFYYVLLYYLYQDTNMYIAIFQ